MQQEAFIRLEGVEKEFRTAAGSFMALKGIDISIRRGEYIGILGASGSGKSTLLTMMTGIDRPSAGEIHIGGEALHNMKEGQLAAWRGRSVGIVFQFFQLMPTLSALENVMLPMDFLGKIPLAQRRKRALLLLERFGISDQAAKLPSAMSGGQQQRAAIARALANDPELLVADEPTGNLDSTTADSIFTAFKQLSNEGKTILLVTHERSVGSLVQRKLILVDGRLAEDSAKVQAGGFVA